MFHISFVYLGIIYPICKTSKKICMPAKMLLVQNWGRMAHLPQPTTGTALHYHRLYQISRSGETNSSLKDKK